MTRIIRDEYGVKEAYKKAQRMERLRAKVRNAYNNKREMEITRREKIVEEALNKERVVDDYFEEREASEIIEGMYEGYFGDASLQDIVDEGEDLMQW